MAAEFLISPQNGKIKGKKGKKAKKEKLFPHMWLKRNRRQEGVALHGFILGRMQPLKPALEIATSLHVPTKHPRMGQHCEICAANTPRVSPKASSGSTHCELCCEKEFLNANDH